MTKEELEIAKAACCVGTIWDEYEGKENFDHMVGLRVKHLIELVRYYQQSSLPSNLDEAAKRIAYDVCKQLPNGEEKDGIVYYAILAAIAGAEWMAGQGVTKEDVVRRTPLNGPVGIEVFLNNEKEFQLGDKVVVQIRKK